MSDSILQAELRPIAEDYRRFKSWRLLGIYWLGVAFFIFLLWSGLKSAGISIPYLRIVLSSLGLIGAIFLYLYARKLPVSLIEIVRKMTEGQANLPPLLLAAIEQQPDSQTGRFSFLQERVILEAFQQQ